jgi:hypothetical protein
LERDAALELIEALGRSLTRRQLEVLGTMYDEADNDDGELVYERGQAFLGVTRIAPRTVTALLRACALHAETEMGADVERYTINETGRKIIERERAERTAQRRSAGPEPRSER